MSSTWCVIGLRHQVKCNQKHLTHICSVQICIFRVNLFNEWKKARKNFLLFQFFSDELFDVHFYQKRDKNGSEHLCDEKVIRKEKDRVVNHTCLHFLENASYVTNKNVQMYMLVMRYSVSNIINFWVSDILTFAFHTVQHRTNCKHCLFFIPVTKKNTMLWNMMRIFVANTHQSRHILLTFFSQRYFFQRQQLYHLRNRWINYA